MNWLLLVFISITTYSLSIILQKIILEDIRFHPISIAIVSEFIAGLIFVLAFLVTGTFDGPGLIHNLLFIILAIFLYSSFNYFSYLSLERIDASKFTILISSRALFTVITASIFLGERLDTLGKVVGMILILLGVVIVTVKKLNKDFFKIGKYETYGLIATILLGVAGTNDAYILNNMNMYTYLASSFLSVALVLFVLSKSGREGLKDVTKDSRFIKIAVLSILIFIAIFTYSRALIIHNASEVASVGVFGTAITVIFGIIFLKERKHLVQKIIGTIVSIIGLLLLTVH